MAALDKDRFFEVMEGQGLALTFADVSLETAASDYGEHEVDISTKFTRNVKLGKPFVAAAMGDVTDHRMGIEMAKQECIAVIPAGFTPEKQKVEVEKVKSEISGVIAEPDTFDESTPLATILNICEAKGWKHRSFPVTGDRKRAVGLLTEDQFDLAKHRSDIVTAGDAMIPLAELTYGGPETTMEEAYALMQKSRIKRVPLLDTEGNVAGLYVWKDVDSYLSGERAAYNTDEIGRLVVAVAIPSGEGGLRRIELMGELPDVYVIDSSTGDKKYPRETLRAAKGMTSRDIMIGNISAASSVKLLIDDGADGIKIGQSPGSICSTERELGYGKPQLSAIFECAKAARGSGVPICADGGVSQNGHISKALAGGADSVMMGRMLVGTKESAAKEVPHPVTGVIMKQYRGEGSRDRMQESDAAQERYDALGKADPLPQGISSLIRIEGSLAKKLGQMEQALRGSMSGMNSKNIEEHQRNTRFTWRTPQGAAELAPHDVEVVIEGYPRVENCLGCIP